MKLISQLSSLFGNPVIRGINLLLSTNPIKRIRARIRKTLANRKLRKSGYLTWRAYKHNRDPDVERYAQYVEDFYIGYPYIFACPNPNHYAYQHICDYGPGGDIYGYHEIELWCHDKIRWNFRCDMHRVYENQQGKMELNDIGGYDIIYFAFKREKDFTHFLLRWA